MSRLGVECSKAYLLPRVPFTESMVREERVEISGMTVTLSVGVSGFRSFVSKYCCTGLSHLLGVNIDK